MRSCYQTVAQAIDDYQSPMTAYLAPGPPVWKKAALAAIYGANHPPNWLPCPLVMRMLRRLECGCRASCQARVTSFNRLVTGMRCILVAIIILPVMNETTSTQAVPRVAYHIHTCLTLGREAQRFWARERHACTPRIVVQVSSLIANRLMFTHAIIQLPSTNISCAMPARSLYYL